MQKLIQSLRKAADRIERFPKDYSWSNASRCNCGHLVTKANNLTLPHFNKVLNKSSLSGTWRVDIIPDIYDGDICPVSYMPIKKLTDELMKMGMEKKDFGELEDLSNPDIKQRAGITADEMIYFRKQRREPHNPRYSDLKVGQLVTRYMRAWADILDEKEKALDLIKKVEAITVPTVTETKQPAQVANKEAVTFKRANAQTL